MIGLAGLATEGGTWYLEKRHGQNTADAAATAGALAKAFGQNVTTSGLAAATLNGYAAGVTIYNPPPAGWAFAGDASAVGALVTKVSPRLFSGLFLASSATITITERAVAKLSTTGGSACLLAGSGGLSFTGSTSVTATNCVLASNATGPSGISLSGAAQVSATSMTTEGGCSGCGAATLSYPPSIYQLPTTDPFAAAESAVLPTFTGASCRAMPSLNGTVALAPSTTQAFCSGQDLKLTNGNTVNLSPGTYFFYNSNIDIQGGTVQCPTCTGALGVTIILTGSGSGANTGTININGGATVNLKAPVTNTWNAAFNGILLFRDSRAPATGNGNKAAVSINGGANTILTGGMDFASSSVQYSGNMSGGGTTLSNCTEIVAQTLNFTGNSALTTSGCAAVGTPVAMLQTVQLVQ